MPFFIMKMGSLLCYNFYNSLAQILLMRIFHLEPIQKRVSLPFFKGETMMPLFSDRFLSGIFDQKPYYSKDNFY